MSVNASYKWFKHWQHEHPNAVILIETRSGYYSFEQSAFAVYRLTSQPLFMPERRERVKSPAITVPRKEYPGLLDRLMRCRISHVVAREDYLVYQKSYNDRFYQIYAAPVESITDAEEYRLDRPVGIDDRITVKNLETHKDCVWTLVPDEEADEGKREKSGKLSADSAVGAQLIGCFSGEDVSVTDEDGSVTKYRIQLAIDPDGRKLKKHRRAAQAAEEEPDEEPIEEPIEEPPVEEPIEEPTEEPIDEPTEESTEEPVEEPIEEPIEEPPIEEPTEDSTEEPTEEPTDEPVDEEPTEEPVPEESAPETAWEETDSGTPFFRRKKVSRGESDPAEPQHFASPDRPVPPELLDAGKRRKPRHFRAGKWFGKKDRE